ncbi:MAG: hypothetical protein AB7F67_04055 [Rhodospirillaceae bacterium]
MADLDEISEAIGSLRAEVRELSRTTGLHALSQSSVAGDVTVMRVKVEQLEKLVSGHAAALEDFKSIKNRGVGALIGAAIAGGGAATAITALLGKLIGKFGS